MKTPTSYRWEERSTQKEELAQSNVANQHQSVNKNPQLPVGGNLHHKPEAVKNTQYSVSFIHATLVLHACFIPTGAQANLTAADAMSFPSDQLILSFSHIFSKQNTFAESKTRGYVCSNSQVIDTDTHQCYYSSQTQCHACKNHWIGSSAP